MAQCKGKRKDGNRCESTKPMPNGYCFSHQDQDPDRPLYKRKRIIKISVKFIGILLTIFGILLTIYLSQQGATKEGQDRTHENQTAMQSQLSEVRRLLKQKDDAEELYKDDFLSRYDLGYCLLAIDRHKRVVSPLKTEINHYKIDWEAFKVLKYVPGKVVFVLSPAILTPRGNRIYGNIIDIPIKIKKPIIARFASDEFTPYFEMVNEAPEGMIILFGISRNMLSDK